MSKTHQFSNPQLERGQFGRDVILKLHITTSKVAGMLKYGHFPQPYWHKNIWFAYTLTITKKNS